MKNIKTSLALLLLISGLCINLLNAQVQNKLPAFDVSLQKRLPSERDTGTYYIASEIQKWNPSETAIIICDMWDQHWCKGAAERVAEMAPFMNNVVSIAREKGIL